MQGKLCHKGESVVRLGLHVQVRERQRKGGVREEVLLWLRSEDDDEIDMSPSFSGILPAAQIMMMQLPIRRLSTRGVQLVAWHKP